MSAQVAGVLFTANPLILTLGRGTGWLPEENPEFARTEFKGPF